MIRTIKTSWTKAGEGNKIKVTIILCPDLPLLADTVSCYSSTLFQIWPLSLQAQPQRQVRAPRHFSAELSYQASPRPSGDPIREDFAACAVFGTCMGRTTPRCVCQVIQVLTTALVLIAHCVFCYTTTTAVVGNIRFGK